MDAIRLSGVEKSFRNVDALRGVTLTIPEGACVGLIGPNGAGKTTLIKTLLGIVFPSAGTIEIFGKDPADIDIKRDVGYLPERLDLPPAYSPRTFLGTVCGFKNIPKSERASETERVLKIVDLDEAAWTRKCGQFSKGMKQRTGLAAALIGRPKLLILDEPTDGIDPMGRAEIRNAITKAKDGGATILLNSHLLTETEKICNTVMILHKGRLIHTASVGGNGNSDTVEIRLSFPAPEARTEALAQGLRAAPLVAGSTEQEQLMDGWYTFAGQQGDIDRLLGWLLGHSVSVLEVVRPKQDLEAILAKAVTNEGRS